ncbi:ABC transporter ATP-binding protein [Ottowia thiooxydans]|uniref:ABC transporter ATP-binding protein n=1 Tax=Ottowia thiooxydans TaxID=219182 RepID=UPI00041F5D79|nr:ABC transporter ATP-binding protein [Ottowia thiooxydans]
MIECKDLWLTYPGAAQPSVCGVSLALEPGEFVTLLGPSGCGKTSTLRSVAGLETPSAGSIRIGESVVFDGTRGHQTPTHARDISMVFQSYAIWPHMTVQQNVAFPLEIARLSREQIRSQVSEALRMVGLDALAERSATQLSGGQQQRVAIARALVRRSGVMLLDEPLSNLDAKLREQMRLELRELIKTVGLTALYVTHDQEEALMLSDRIALMSAGRIVEQGTPLELYLHPSTRFGATFLGAAEVFDVVRARGREIDTADGALALNQDTTGVAHVAIRPEAILATQSGDPHGPNRWNGRLISAIFSGRQQQLVVELAGGRRVNVLAPPTTAFRVQEPVTLELPAERLMPLARA